LIPGGRVLSGFDAQRKLQPDESVSAATRATSVQRDERLMVFVSLFRSGSYGIVTVEFAPSERSFAPPPVA
jgi:hypothetical protein